MCPPQKRKLQTLLLLLARCLFNALLLPKTGNRVGVRKGGVIMHLYASGVQNPDITLVSNKNRGRRARAARLRRQLHQGVSIRELRQPIPALPHRDRALLTGLLNIQVVRTADVSDIAAIIFVRDKHPESDVLMAAKRMT